MTKVSTQGSVTGMACCKSVGLPRYTTVSSIRAIYGICSMLISILAPKEIYLREQSQVKISSSIFFLAVKP